MGHILIVEDDLRLAQLTSEYLSGNGFTVSLENNGALAVQRITEEQPDLGIILNL